MLNTENVLVQSKRFRGKINIQRPKPPHYERKLFNAVTEPIYEWVPLVADCRKKQIERINTKATVEEPHPYERILAREFREAIDASEMQLVCQKNSIIVYDNFKFQVALRNVGVTLKAYNKKIQRFALKDTKYANLLKLTEVPSCYLLGPPSAIPAVLKILRKTPQMILLGGIIGDRMLSKNELVNYSQLPDIQVVRAQFAATLHSAAGGQLVNNLQAHQSNLCYLLDAHAKALGGPSDEPSDTQSVDQATPTETKNE